MTVGLIRGAASGWMKTVVSQTIFANVTTLPRGSNAGAGTPKLRVMEPGQGAQGEIPVADHDSNGDRRRRAIARCVR